MIVRRLVGVVVAASVLAVVVVGTGSAAPDRARRNTGGTVSVLYAGSLVNVMEQKIGPAFQQASGYSFQGFAGGSGQLANEVKGGLRQGDVFISAAPKVNSTLMGTGNGDWVSWFDEFATAPLVIGYNPHSRFASQFKRKAWYTVFEQPGILLGRTDPTLDPKGQLALQFMAAAQKIYHQPGLVQRALGQPENPAQIFPEETLLGRLEAGQLDAGFFYSIEANEAHIPVITPPLGKRYGARYTITVLRNAPDEQGAIAFVRFLLGPTGKKLLIQDGFHLLAPEIGGSSAAIPPELQPLFRRPKHR